MIFTAPLHAEGEQWVSMNMTGYSCIPFLFYRCNAFFKTPHNSVGFIADFREIIHPRLYHWKRIHFDFVHANTLKEDHGIKIQTFFTATIY